MDDFVFFLDYDEEHDALNVFAAATNAAYNERMATGSPEEPYRDPDDGMYEGYGAVYFHDDSGVNWISASPEYVGPRIPEGAARKIHPRLFQRIKQVEENHGQSSD